MAQITDIEILRNRFLDERPLYAELARLVASDIQSAAIAGSIRCDVSWRVKEVSSFLKKALRKRYDDPYTAIKDKAGVRVMPHYPWDIGKVETLVQSRLIVCSHEDKRASVSFQTLEYRGTHYEVQFDTAIEGVDGLVCEVQVLTKAESLWADTAHYLSYKPAQTPSSDVQRAIYRLIALIEIFDSEVKNAYEILRVSENGYGEAKLLDAP